MRIAVFSTCSYDQEFLVRFNTKQELVFFPQPLTAQNVLITSHQGVFTRKAIQQIAEATFLNADAFVLGEMLVNEVKR